MNPSATQLRQLESDNARYPEHLVAVPREEWPDHSKSPFQTGSLPVAVYRCRSFIVVVWIEPNNFIRLSVQRTEWEGRQKRFLDDISWDDLQRLKAEAGYAAECAVEVFPPDRDVVNVANMRHLFLLPSAPPFMWRRARHESEAA